jgi:D-glycerate 3-kinase
MHEGWYEPFLVEERLPQTFRRTTELVCKPLARIAARLGSETGRTIVVGLCGAQGSGKSTIALAIGRILEAHGLRTAVISLDDLYLSRSERERLAIDVNPLLLTRGPPGTHDVDLGAGLLDALSNVGRVALPRFDKARDTRRARAEWGMIHGPVDVVLFEGWCVGAQPETPAALGPPCNALEAEHDQDGRWRSYVNDALGGPYRRLFGKIDYQVLLRAPSFEVVHGWRNEQERKLRERLRREGRVGSAMSDADIAFFIAHYERLTRHILSEMPSRADWMAPLGVDRTPYPDVAPLLRLLEFRA